jgi:hypothetical protein
MRQPALFEPRLAPALDQRFHHPSVSRQLVHVDADGVATALTSAGETGHAPRSPRASARW